MSIFSQLVHAGAGAGVVHPPKKKKHVPAVLIEPSAKSKKQEVHLHHGTLDVGAGSSATGSVAGHHPMSAQAVAGVTHVHGNAHVGAKKSGGSLPLASIDVTGGLGREIGKGLSSGLHVLENAGKDAINFPKQAVLGIYGIGHAAEQLAVHGRTKELKALADGLSRGAAGELLIHGDPARAAKLAVDHPLMSALDFTGAEGLLGRGAGAAARTAGKLGKEGNVLARAGSTVRADLRHADTGQVEQRRYDKDLIKKALQVSSERRAIKRGEDPNLASPKATKHALNRGADESASQVDAVRRVDKGDADQVAVQLEDKRGVTRRSSPLNELVSGVIEGGIRKPAAAFRSDLKDELQRLNGVDRTKLKPEARINNRRQVAALDKMLSLKPDEFEKARTAIVGKAEIAAPELDRIEAEKIATGALDPDQALAAKLRTYAVKRLGHRYEPAKSSPEEMVARHETAKTVEARAKAQVAAVRSELDRAMSKRDRAVGRITAARAASKDAETVYKAEGEEFATRKAAVEAHPGKPVERVPITRAEADRVGELAQHDRNIKALKQQRRQASAAEGQARRARVASHPKQYVTGLVDETGRRVTTARILEAIKADPHAHMPSFLPHITSEAGGRAHFVNFFGGRRQLDTKGVRTGSAALTGSQDASIKAVGNAIVRGQGEVSAIRGFDRSIADLAKKNDDGTVKLQDADAAEAEARDSFDEDGQLKPGRVAYDVVRAIPSKIKGERRETVEGLQNAKSVGKERLNAARKPAVGEARKEQSFALVPTVQMERLAKHQKGGSGDLAKVVQAYTGAFRGTVLPFSVKWLAGNSVEAALRLAIQDNPVGLVASHVAGRRVLAALEHTDKTAWREFQARATSGLQYGGQHQTYRGAERSEGTPVEAFAQRAAALRQVPIVRILPNRIAAFQRRVFQINKAIERNAQITALGKEARREIESQTGSWGKAMTLQKAAVEDVAKGLVNTPNQVRFARAVDETLGKYNRFSPAMRSATSTVAPFLPWYLNSLKLIYHTLPGKHPIKTALLASVEQTLQGDFAKTHKDAFPDLKGALRTAGGGFLDLSRYTPFGVLNEGGTAATGVFFPQFQNLVFTTAGLNFTGHPLRLQSGEKVEGGSTKAIVMALYSAFESIAPGVSIGRRLQEGGESAFDDSTIVSPKSRPGTAYGQHLPGIPGRLSSAVNRIVSPVRPTFLHGGPTQDASPLASSDSSGNPWVDAEAAAAAQQQDPEAQAWASAYGP